MIEELLARPAAFEFFQAVRLLELERAAAAGAPDAVGEDLPPEREAVRFRVHPGLSHPAGAVRRVVRGAPSNGGAAGEERPSPATVEVTFLGMVGVAGVLPDHYSRLVLERLHGKDRSLRDFLDLFHHRTLALFHRAWRKYRLPFAFEHHALREGREDPATAALYALVGLGTVGLRRRLAVDDATLVFHGGTFARRVRPAIALQEMLAEAFGAPVRVLSFIGRWIEMPARDRSRLPCRGERELAGARLGRSLALGERVWDVASMVRLVVGPLSHADFEHLAPDEPARLRFDALARAFLGQEIDFDVELVLAAGESPGVRLGDAAGAARLGRDLWLEHAPRPAAERRARFDSSYARAAAAAGGGR